VPPTAAGGKVFVATSGDREIQRRYFDQRPTAFPANYFVTVYGLLDNAHVHPKPIVNKDGDDVTVAKAAATAGLVLDTKTCTAASPGNVDCTAALSKKFGAPSLHAVVVPAGYGFAGCTL